LLRNRRELTLKENALHSVFSIRFSVYKQVPFENLAQHLSSMLYGDDDDDDEDDDDEDYVADEGGESDNDDDDDDDDDTDNARFDEK